MFTLVATDMVLVGLFPNTFQHRVWTFHSSKFWWCVRLLATPSPYSSYPTTRPITPDTGNPERILVGYLVVVFWNILITFVVCWLLQRRSTAVNGSCTLVG